MNLGKLTLWLASNSDDFGAGMELADKAVSELERSVESVASTSTAAAGAMGKFASETSRAVESIGESAEAASGAIAQLGSETSSTAAQMAGPMRQAGGLFARLRDVSVSVGSTIGQAVQRGVARFGQALVEGTSRAAWGMAMLNKRVVESAQSVQKVAEKVKSATAEFAQLGVAASAVALGALALAAQSSGRAMDQMERLKAATRSLAVEAMGVVGPVIDSLTAVVQRLGDILANMDPRMKSFLGSLLQWVAVGGIASGVISRTAGAVGGLAKAVEVSWPLLTKGAMALQDFTRWASTASVTSQGIGGAMRAAGAAGVSGFGAIAGAVLPVLATLGLIAAAIAAVVVVVAWMKRAWVQNWGDIQGKTAAVVEWLSRAWEAVKEAFATLIKWMTKAWADNLRRLADGVQGFMRLFGVDVDVTWVRTLADELESGALIDKALNLGRSIGSSIVDGIKDTGGAVADLFAPLAKYVGLFGGKKAGAGALLEVNVSAPAARDMGAQALETRDRLGAFARGEALALAPARQVQALLASSSAEMGRLLSSGLQNAGANITTVVIRESKSFGQKVQAAIRAIGSVVQQLASSLAESIQSSSGIFGRTLQAAMRGLEAGGWIGAIAGALAELVSSSRQLQALGAILGVVGQRMADTVGRLLEPLLPLAGALADVVSRILDALAPVLDLLGPLLDITPILELVAEALVALGPVLRVLSGAVQALLAPTRALGEVALRVLFDAVKWLSVGVLWVARAIGEAWNGIIGGIQWVLEQLVALDVGGWKPFAGLQDWVNRLEGQLVDVEGLTASLVELQGMTWEQARAAAQQTAAALGAAQALDSLSGTLNAPSGWKVDLARWRAAEAAVGPGQVGGGMGGLPAGGGGVQAPPIGGGGAAPVVEVNILAGPSVVRQLQVETRLLNSRGGGISVPTLTPYVTEP